jgi:hypothetical protein
MVRPTWYYAWWGLGVQREQEAAVIYALGILVCRALSSLGCQNQPRIHYVGAYGHQRPIQYR